MKNEISVIGEVLYGVKWKAPLAKKLGVNPITLARYASGEFAINPIHYKKLMELLVQKKTEVMNAEYLLSVLFNSKNNLPLEIKHKDFSLTIPRLKKLQFGNQSLKSISAKPIVDGFELKSVALLKQHEDEVFIVVNYFCLNSIGKRIFKTINFPVKLEQDISV